jgi:hypothetical protein
MRAGIKKGGDIVFAACIEFSEFVGNGTAKQAVCANNLGRARRKAFVNNHQMVCDGVVFVHIHMGGGGLGICNRFVFLVKNLVAQTLRGFDFLRAGGHPDGNFVRYICQDYIRCHYFARHTFVRLSGAILKERTVLFFILLYAF